MLRGLVLRKNPLEVVDRIPVTRYRRHKLLRPRVGEVSCGHGRRDKCRRRNPRGGYSWRDQCSARRSNYASCIGELINILFDQIIQRSLIDERKDVHNSAAVHRVGIRTLGGQIP